jgi:hypothetical protein
MFTEDLTPFLDVAAGFAVSAVIGAATVPVIFDAAYTSAGGMVESTGPQCQGKSSDLAAAVQGTAITINGQPYTVTGNQPDGTGMTVLQLREA